jgi:hypothetical protein
MKCAVLEMLLSVVCLAGDFICSVPSRRCYVSVVCQAGDVVIRSVQAGNTFVQYVICQSGDVFVVQYVRLEILLYVSM